MNVLKSGSFMWRAKIHGNLGWQLAFYQKFPYIIELDWEDELAVLFYCSTRKEFIVTRHKAKIFFFKIKCSILTYLVLFSLYYFNWILSYWFSIDVLLTQWNTFFRVFVILGLTTAYVRIHGLFNTRPFWLFAETVECIQKSTMVIILHQLFI